MRVHLALIGVALALSACATKKENSSVPLDAGRTVRYTIPGELAGDLSDTAIIALYVQAIRATTAYRLEQLDAGGDTMGVRVSARAAGVSVAYLHWHSASLHHDHVADFGVTTTRRGNDVIVDVTCPDAMRIERAGFIMTYPPFIEPDRATADLRSICGKAQLSFPRRETGEVDVPFNDSAVYANFKRKLTAATNLRPMSNRAISPSSPGSMSRMARERS